MSLIRRLQNIAGAFINPATEDKQDDIISNQTDGTQLTKLSANSAEVDTQHPLPTNGDSVYAKDINTDTSSIGNFSGVITDLFDDLRTTITDSTSDNPKSLVIKLNRPIDTGMFKFCTGVNNFSNVKLTLKDRAGTTVGLVDDSANSTKYTSKEYIVSTPVEFCDITIEFYTVDTISLDFIAISKNLNTHSQILAISEDTGESEFITSSNGNLAMIVRIRDAEGNTKINPSRGTFQNPLGSGSNGSVTLTNANTSYPIPAVAQTEGYRINIHNGSDSDIYIGYEDSNTNGIILYSGDTLEDNIGANSSLYAYCASTGKVLTYSYKLSE